MYIKHDLDDFLDYLRHFEINAFTCHRQKHFVINIRDKNNSKLNDVIEVYTTNDYEYKLLNRELRLLYQKE